MKALNLFSESAMKLTSVGSSLPFKNCTGGPTPEAPFGEDVYRLIMKCFAREEKPDKVRE
jgi:hypothetical protein